VAPTFTATPLPPRPTATWTTTKAAASGPATILQAAAVPNPDPTGIQVQLSGRADTVDVKVYTESMHLVAEDAAGSGGPGWLQVPLPPGFATYTPAGTYFYSVQAFTSGQGTKAVKGTLVILH
jgi:hypothetical protein